MKKRAIIIDGNSLMFRAYYGTISQVDFYVKNNIFVANAIKTMMQMIFKILENNNYDYGVIAYDHKEPNFRKQKYSEYKSQRKQTPQYLIDQIPIIHNTMTFFGLNSFCIKGLEADDIVGITAKLLSDKNIECDIYSSDNDLLQLVDNNINVIQFKKGITEYITFNNQNFESLNQGLKPLQIIDYKALCGDSSDNLPGVKGIGKKTAIDLIKQFENIENIYKNIDFIKSGSVKQKLIDGKDSAFMCKELATIITTANLIDDYQKLKKEPIDFKKIKEVIKQFNFSGFSKYLKD